MRLIDADAMKEMISAVIKKQNGKDNDLVPINELQIFIDEQPTAYDIDKVVSELEKKKEEVQRMRNTCVALSDLEVCDIENVTYKRAIEIVKQGSVTDDVCEWKWEQSHGQWNGNPQCIGDMVLFDLIRLFTYCPYCGKKIKVVE